MTRLLNITAEVCRERYPDLLEGLDDPFPWEAETEAERKRIEALAVARRTGAVRGQQALLGALGIRPTPKGAQPAPGARPLGTKPTPPVVTPRRRRGPRE